MGHKLWFILMILGIAWAIINTIRIKRLDKQIEGRTNVAPYLYKRLRLINDYYYSTACFILAIFVAGWLW